jgi:hypothetical protein
MMLLENIELPTTASPFGKGGLRGILVGGASPQRQIPPAPLFQSGVQEALRLIEQCFATNLEME